MDVGNSLLLLRKKILPFSYNFFCIRIYFEAFSFHKKKSTDQHRRVRVSLNMIHYHAKIFSFDFFSLIDIYVRTQEGRENEKRIGK